MALGGRIPHAQLFLGYQGNQKLALALAYAQFLNCKNKQIFSEPNADGLLADSCGTCPSCIKFGNLAHPDLHFFFPNNKTKSMKESDSSDYMDEWRKIVQERHAEFSVNQWYDAMGLDNSQGYINKRDVDNVIKALTYKNFEAQTKVIILWMVEKFYHDISTRLLKVLEEPSEGTVFLLISENANQIPATILSRTQLVRVPKTDDAIVQQYLQKTYEISSEEAIQIARRAKGNLLEAETIVARTDDDNFNHTNFVDWMRMCLTVDTAQMDAFSRKMRDLGRERLKLFLNHALEKIRWAVMMNYHNADQILISPEERAWLTKFAPFIHSANLMKFVAEIEKAIYHIERNANGHLVMMDLSIKLSGLLKKKP
jgi:DNA polymerase-3 subunit delta'